MIEAGRERSGSKTIIMSLITGPGNEEEKNKWAAGGAAVDLACFAIVSASGEY